MLRRAQWNICPWNVRKGSVRLSGSQPSSLPSLDNQPRSVRPIVPLSPDWDYSWELTCDTYARQWKKGRMRERWGWVWENGRVYRRYLKTVGVTIPSVYQLPTSLHSHTFPYSHLHLPTPPPSTPTPSHSSPSTQLPLPIPPPPHTTPFPHLPLPHTYSFPQLSLHTAPPSHTSPHPFPTSPSHLPFQLIKFPRYDGLKTNWKYCSAFVWG